MSAAQAGALQQHAAIARLARGDYVAAGSDDAGALTWIRLDAQAQPLSGDTVFAPPGSTSPGVTAFPDGGFLATWIAPPPPTFTLTLEVMGQRYDASGAPVGPRLPLASVGLGGSAKATALMDGSFILTTFGQSSRVGGPSGYVRHFTAQAQPTPIGGALHQDACGIDSAPRATALQDGGFVLAWVYRCQHDSELVTRVYGRDGAFRESRIRVADPRDLSLATLRNGHYVLAWTAGASGAETLLARIVDPSGPSDGTGAPLAIAWRPGRHPLPVASLSTGGFVMAWSALGPHEARVPVDRYDNAGQRQ